METTLPHHIMKRRQSELLKYIIAELAYHGLTDLSKSPYYTAGALSNERVAILSETGKVLETFEPSESPAMEKKRAKAFILGLVPSASNEGLEALRAWAKATLELRDAEHHPNGAPGRMVEMVVASGSTIVSVNLADLRSFLKATESK